MALLPAQCFRRSIPVLSCLRDDLQARQRAGVLDPRKVEKSTYYLTHNQLTGKSYASPAMKFELERAQSLDSMENFKLKIKPIGYDKRKDIPSGKPNPRSLIR